LFICDRGRGKNLQKGLKKRILKIDNFNNGEKRRDEAEQRAGDSLSGFVATSPLQYGQHSPFAEPLGFVE
jgi:hypothetical protein